MVDRQVLEEVLGIALRNGGDFADIYIEHKKVTGIGCEGGKIERVHSGLDVGAGIRVVSGDATAYAYTNDLTREGMADAAEIVSHAARGDKKDYNIDLTKVKPRVEFNFGVRPDSVKTEDKVVFVESADRAARDIGEALGCTKLP